MQNQITVAKISNVRVQNQVTGEAITLYPVENDVEYSFDALMGDVKMTNGPTVGIYTQQPGKVRVGTANSPEVRDYIKRQRNQAVFYTVTLADDAGFVITYSASLTNTAEISFKANDHKVELNFSGKVIS